MRVSGLAAIGLIVAAAALQGAASPPDVQELKRAFAQPPSDARIMMRWWWFGPAVTKPELESEMRAIKEAGIGGFEVQPVYPLALDDPAHGFRNLPFLSPEFLDALRFTAQKARELGLRMDLTLGSGWPYGGPQISRELASGKLRCERVAVAPGQREVVVPSIAPQERLIAAFLGTQRLELPAAGVVTLPASAQAGTVLLFISSQTGMMVKRAAAGAEGFVLNHYSRPALDHYLRTVGEPLLAALGPDRPYAIFCDSLEVYGADWTADFLAEFQKRRGYDLTPFLPALVGDIGQPDRRYPQRLGPHADRTGRGELPDPAPRVGAAARDSTARAGVRHAAGHPLQRSFGGLARRRRFLPTPLDVKAEADRHFLEGVNQLVGHGWPYSPESLGEPGWRFYAAAALNQHNPWWDVMPDLALYLQRLSFLLRQGRPANDVALYLPVADARAAATPGRVSINDSLQKTFGNSAVIPRILEAGYGFDFVDDAALTVKGVSYPVVILPDVERIPVETYRKLEVFVKGGGRLIATRRTPSLAPGFIDSESRSAEVREISRRLFSSAGAKLVPTDDAIPDPLRAALAPDVSLSAGASQVGFIHRSTPSTEIYFLANTGNTRVHPRATFRVSSMHPEFWNPFTGAAVPARSGNALDLDFEPYESRVVVFSRAAVPKAKPAPTSVPPAVDLSEGWDVTFEGAGTHTAWEKTWTT